MKRSVGLWPEIRNLTSMSPEGTHRDEIMQKALDMGYKRSAITAGINNLKYQGYLEKLPRGRYRNTGRTTSPIKSKTTSPKQSYSALEIGNSVIDLIDNLRAENRKLKEDLEELKILTDDYDRLSADNRVLNERVIKLTTQLSASNSRSLKL